MIRAQNVYKFYDSKRALGPVSFEIEDGETVGFLGLNGAGKTTALRIFACDLRPSSGSVVIGDIDVLANPHEVCKRIGYLPENPPLYTDMTVGDFLAYAGQLRHMSKHDIRKRLPAVLEMTDLLDVEKEVISTLSHGFRQRIGIAQAIVHEPMLIILDEPTRGLDPVQIVEMRKMIQVLKANHTILVSSHILTEISATCDRLLVLDQGEVIAMGREDDLAKTLASQSKVIVVVKAAPGSKREEIAILLQGIHSVRDVTNQGNEEGTTAFTLQSSEDIRAEICRVLVKNGHDILKLTQDEHELESIFLKLISSEMPRTDSNAST